MKYDIDFVTVKTQDEKYKLMEFVYNNTNSFIMNTFGFLWETRRWWNINPILTFKQDGVLVGLHAFAVSTKQPYDKLKTYYIVVDKNHRGKKIAKQMTLVALDEFKHCAENFYVNSEESSDGVAFYKSMFKDRYTTKRNEFGTIDYVFEAPIMDIINENTVHSSVTKS